MKLTFLPLSFNTPQRQKHSAIALSNCKLPNDTRFCVLSKREMYQTVNSASVSIKVR